MQNLRKTIGIIALVLLLITQGVIFALTAQPAEDSSALSDSVEAAITAPTSDNATIPIDAAAPQKDDEEASGTATEVTSLSPVQELITWALSKADVRKWAHLIEFIPTGLLAALAFLALGGALRKRTALAGSVTTCFALSLFDQAHKLFVPGRHFDLTDLAFDATGYLIAILITFAIWVVIEKLSLGDGNNEMRSQHATYCA